MGNLVTNTNPLSHQLSVTHICNSIHHGSYLLSRVTYPTVPQRRVLATAIDGSFSKPEPCDSPDLGCAYPSVGEPSGIKEADVSSGQRN